MHLTAIATKCHAIVRALWKTSEPLYVQHRGAIIARIGPAATAIIPPSFHRVTTTDLRTPTATYARLLVGEPVVVLWGHIPSLVLVPV